MEFEQVYDLYFRDVYRYILKLSGSEHVAEEITSDTFFKALRSIGKFRGSCDMRVWLCQIAKNCYYLSAEGKAYHSAGRTAGVCGQCGYPRGADRRTGGSPADTGYSA